MSASKAKVTLVDLQYLGRRESIASALLETDDGLAVVDPGPSTALPGLRAGLAGCGATVADLKWVLLTHIHLDHAGAAGTLVRESPGLQVLVHERGAPHLLDPARLLASATRIYGDQMDALWGEFVPVPRENIRALAGGETLALPGRGMRVAVTPGHAWHHVAYLDEPTGTAFVGDVAGERYPGCTFVIPVTPPPDIDLEAWRSSWDVVRAWNPSALFLTHFGPFEDVRVHLDQLERRTDAWAEQVRLSLERDEPDEARAGAFYEWVGRELHAQLPDALAERYARAAGVLDSWHGLARYWRKRAERQST